MFGLSARGCIENDTDTITDYFETDTIRLVPSHPLFPAAKVAMDKMKARKALQADRWIARHSDPRWPSTPA